MEKIDKIFTFNSVQEVCKYIKQTPNCDDDPRSNITSSERTEFTGTNSLEEALSLLQEGDGKLLEKILSSTNAPKLNAQRQRTSGLEIYRSAQGFIPNMGAVMAGHPVNMYNCRRTFNKSTKVLNIFYDISIPFTTSTNEIIKASTKIFNYIYAKEAEGFRINLYVGCIARFVLGKKTIMWSVKLKSSDEHFDPLRTAFPLCHPSFLRRIIFALMERANIKASSNSYGHILPPATAKQAIQTKYSNFDYYNIETLDCIK